MTDAGRTVLMPRARVAIGTELNGIYRIDQPIAAGGMGEVYKGYNIQTGDPVAIKMIRSDLAENEAALGLFRKEALALGNLHHEAIVRYYIFAVDPTLNRAYLAMEYVDGISLKDMLVRGPLSYEQVRILQTRLASGLHAAHKVGIIHRDVSPDNVLAPSGDLSQAKILDFGIARSTKAGEQTIIGSGFAGKFNYVSPEQLGMYGGDVTAKSDIYSLGLVLAESLLGRPIDMGGSQVEVIDKRRSVPDLTAIDARLRPLISEMLAPHPDDRPESMAAVAEWEPSKKGKTKPPRATTGSTSAAGSSEKSKMPMIAAAAVVLLGLGGGGAYFASGMMGGGSSSQLAQEERQAQEARRHTAEKQAEQAALDAQRKREEEVRQSQERAELARRREQEEKRLADIQRQEAERRAEETRKIEENQRADALRKQDEELQAAMRQRQDNERRAAELRRQEEVRKAAEAKKLEDERKAAEAKRLEEERKAAEAKRIAEERRQAELKKQEDERKAAEAKRLEEERKAEDERRLAEQRRIEDDRKREELRLAEEQTRKELEARKLADEQKAAAERKLAEDQAAAQKAEEEKMRLAQEAARARWDAELAAAMVRQGITPNAGTATPGAGQQVALADPATAKPVSDPATTTRGVQSQLARLGCFAGAVDGQATKVLDEAIQRYRKRTGKTGTVNPADEVLLQELQAQGVPQASCECLKGQTPQKNNCVVPQRAKQPVKKKETVRRQQPPRRQQAERPAPRQTAPARPNIGGIGF